LCRFREIAWTRFRMILAMIPAGDIVLAAVLALLAARFSPGRVEAEALVVRQRALESAAGTIPLSAILLELLRLVNRLLSRRRS